MLMPKVEALNQVSLGHSEESHSPLKSLTDVADVIMDQPDFGNMSSLDLMTGMEINPGCTPIKFSKQDNDEGYEKKPSPHLLQSAFSQSLSTPPSILRRGKYRRRQGATLAEELENVLHELEEPLDGVSSDELVADSQPAMISQPLPTTPVRVPFENLPFSPSQFLNSPSHSLGSKLTSTPMSSQASYGHSSSNGGRESSPRTPTPFKHAIAEVERRAQSKTWHIQHNRRVRQSLEIKLEPDHDSTSESLFHSPETPSKSLAGDTSLLLSPPSIIKETLPEEVLEEVFSLPQKRESEKKTSKKSAKKIMFTDSPQKQLLKIDDPSYQKVACGLTKDQIDMTQLAKSYLQD